ncbi:MAG: apolipoprotein A1/A4/E family protein [Nanoarchaeota archaeon]|nr:apolipoprotein A1/A4/E family protein [Nanoarchaeota archaeon]
MRKKCLVLFLGMIISLSIFSYSAMAQLDALAAPFKGLVDILKNDNIVFGILFFLFFILLYAVFVGGLNTIPSFKSEEAGKFTKNAKIVALTLSGITVLSTFFVLGRTDVLAHAKRIASMFNLFFAVILSVFFFFIIRHTFKGEGTIWGLETKNLMSVLALVLALYVFGTIGQSAWALGMGMSIFVITGIVVLGFALSGLGRADEAPAAMGAAPYVPRGIDDVFGEQREQRLGGINAYAAAAENWIGGGRQAEIDHINEDLTSLTQALNEFPRANNIQNRFNTLQGIVRANPTPDNQRLQADFTGLINGVNRILREAGELQRRVTDQTRSGQQSIEARREALRGILERGRRGNIVDRVEELREAVNTDNANLRTLNTRVGELTQEWGDMQNRVWEGHILPQLQTMGIQ